MRSKKEIREKMEQIKVDDQKCPAKAHELGLTCFDVGHAIRGTHLAALKWALGDEENIMSSNTY